MNQVIFPLIVHPSSFPPNFSRNSATRLDSILAEIARLNARAVIVDSIQTVYLDEIPSSAGSVNQV